MTAGLKWRLLLCFVAVEAIVFGAGLYTFTLWAGPWISEFQASHADVMAIVALKQLTSGLSTPFIARLTEKLEIRKVMFGGALLVAATLGLISLTVSMAQVTALYALPLALGMVATGPVIGHIIAVKLFHPKPALPLAVITLGLSIGGLSVPPVAALLLAQYGWRASFVAFSLAVACLLLPVIWFGLRGLPGRAAHATASDHQATPLSTRQIVSDRFFIGTVLISATLAIVYNAAFFNLGPWLQERGESAEQASYLVAATSAATAVGILGIGAIADRIGKWPLIWTLILLEGGGLALAATNPSYPVLCVALPAMALATGGIAPLLAFLVVGRFGPHNFARANGLAFMFLSTGALGALLGGWGRDELGSYPATFQFLLLSFVACAIGVVLLFYSPSLADSSGPRVKQDA